MEENRAGTQEKKDLYEYVNMPKNVRQIGVPLPGTKIYLEDYVITYLKQAFVNMEESRVVILLGKKGTQKAEDSIFLYGAVALEEEDILENGKIEKETWDHIHEVVHQHFSGAQVFGCACGVNVWNSDMEGRVRRLQKGEFATQNRILFLWDLCEKEEKMFIWQRGMVREQSGYYIYFEKNPQMQDFMLDRQKEPESIDADYQDRVTDTMRHVIGEKEERRKKWQIINYCGAVAAGIAILSGVHMMMDSTERIRSMEETVDALSEYVVQQRDQMEQMSQQAENAVQRIPFESQSTAKPKEDRSEKNLTGEMQAATTDPGRKKDGARTTADTGDQTGNKQGTQKKTAAQKEGNNDEGTMDISEEMALQAMKKDARSYIVQKGDTLSQIVWRQYHDASYEKPVKKVNGIKDADKIYEGQCIWLPKFK